MKLGRYEYCIETIATSPWVAYSRALAALGSIHPLPVPPPTPMAPRWNPPRARSSATAIWARSVAVGAASTPMKARTGSTAAGSPTTPAMSPAVKPWWMNARPSRPMLSHVTVDSGPPDRYGDSGFTTPGLSLSLFPSKIESARSTALPTSRPDRTVQVTNTVATIARSQATLVGSTFPSGRKKTRPRALMARPMPSSRAATASPTRGESNHSHGTPVSIPSSSRCSPCQVRPIQAPTSSPTTASTASTCQATRRAPGGRFGRCSVR